MKKKLLSAGCSLIYGAELSDSPDYHGRSNASLKTWPSLLSTQLNYDYYTCSMCGISNQGITRHVMDVCERYDFDLLVVQWTFFSRYELRFNKKYKQSDGEYSNYSNLSPWMTDHFKSLPNWSNEKNKERIEVLNNKPAAIKKAVNFWFSEIDSYDTSIYNYLKCTTELATYLKWKNIPFIFSSAQAEPAYADMSLFKDTSIDTLYKIHRSMPIIDFHGMGFYEWAKEQQFEFGIDHPLDEAHFEAFKLVLEQFNKIFM